MITSFGKCSSDITKDEISLWMSNISNKSFADAISEIVDFYTHARPSEKNLIEDCFGSMGFWEETFNIKTEENSNVEEND